MQRTNAFKKMVLYVATARWNRLPIHLTLIENNTGFKKKLKESVIQKDINLRDVPAEAAGVQT